MKSNVEKTWTTQAGYEAEVVAMPMGHRCGYVTVPAGHPCENKEYQDLDIEVHGGLTYSDGAKFGFDCAHYHDKKDVNLMSEEYREVYKKYPPPFDDGEIRTLEYCIEQCERLAAQLKELT
jgi:hypothetical protein